jgi:hypothetical protein
MYKKQTYTRYSDGTHAHHRAWGIEYCSQEHKRPLPTWAKNIIILQAFVNFTLITHLILKANNY